MVIMENKVHMKNSMLNKTEDEIVQVQNDLDTAQADLDT